MNSTFYKNFIILFSGTTLSQIIPFAAAFIISRVYTNEEFGFYGYYITIAGILSVFATLKYEVALIVSDSEEKALRIMQTVLFIAIVFTLILFICVGFLYLFYKISFIYFLLPFSVFAIALYTSIDRYYNRFSHYKSMSILRMTKSGGEAIYNVLGSLHWLRPFNLILGFTGGYALGVIYFIITQIKLCRKILSSFSLRNIRVTLLEYKDFAMFSFPHTLLNTVSTSIPVLLIPYYFDNTILGLYMFGFKYVQAPLSLISGSVYNVFGQELKDCMNSREARIKIFNSLIKKLFFLALLMIPFLICAPFFFRLFFGENWTNAGKYIQILTPWIVLNFILSTLANVPVLFQMQRKALFLELIYSIVKLIPFIIFAGVFNFSMNEVLVVYVILTTFVLSYCLYWNRKLIYAY
jgi:O-antigen/teichoic acid export membrane protein